MLLENKRFIGSWKTRTVWVEQHILKVSCTFLLWFECFLTAFSRTSAAPLVGRTLTSNVFPQHLFKEPDSESNFINPMFTGTLVSFFFFFADFAFLAADLVDISASFHFLQSSKPNVGVARAPCGLLADAVEQLEVEEL